jgi:hypothetical protein
MSFRVGWSNSNLGISAVKTIILCFAFLLVSIQLNSVGAQPAAKEPGKARPLARIALVSSGTSDNVGALLDLAQAKISAQPGVELLDRQAMTRILQEQKLSLSGLVDASTAVRAGKLLSVDLFAFVEADPASKDALGLVVYDAATGVKLHDASLPAGKLDEQIEAIAGGVPRLKKLRGSKVYTRFACSVFAMPICRARKIHWAIRSPFSWNDNYSVRPSWPCWSANGLTL